ncbi:hypothetical protein ELI_2944 [Eubacterium callanderi]|uniref:Uncharacterized protein n=1 Tax=Eubacterium callanderi TaxID=53442 RepID=E3GEC7_9FIRM|nr:hypothetical protein ELI_2944 [Eubacterium callanderi]
MIRYDSDDNRFSISKNCYLNQYTDSLILIYPVSICTKPKEKT